MNYKELRNLFPILNQEITYFDNAATSPTCKPCIDAITSFYKTDCFNIHRGAYKGSLRSERRVDECRMSVQNFINAESKKEIIFTSGATESLNLISNSIFSTIDFKGKNIVTTELEHHSNFVPWMVKDLKVKIATCEIDGSLNINKVLDLIDCNTQLVTITACSNVTGDIIPLEQVIKRAHEKGALVLVDASQYVAHRQLDVQQLDCDFAVFSAHKIFGPTGIGVLYGKGKILEGLNPPKFGGGMVSSVKKQQWLSIPSRFEAGTLNLSGIIGLGATIKFIDEIGIDKIEERENKLKNYLYEKIQEIKGVLLYSRNANSAPIISFYMDGLDSYDIAMFLATKEICIRSGKLCAQPFFERIKKNSLIRISLSFVNTEAEIDFLISSLKQLRKGWANDKH